ncbi:outer membrane protein [Legionella sp. D16C41]|uniref:outer membrane protein n=1 Tax=Legionella sp. D16C41 TaxID=3402688 RepID=UPI003AF7CDDA
MKRRFILLSLTTSLLTQSVLAGGMGPAFIPSWTWVGTISLGPVWEDGGRTQNLFLTPEIEKKYVNNKSTDTLFDGEAFIGIQKILSPTLQGQLGIAVAATSNANLDGVIWDDADPEFANYSYRYKIQHTHVAAKGKLLLDQGYWFIPWISGSIGVGFNDAHSFHNNPLIPEAVPNPNFTSNVKTTFTYTVGAGIQKALNDHWQVGVGYEFADWGKSRLDRAYGQTLNSGLTLNHLYTNGVMFNLSYLA